MDETEVGCVTVGADKLFAALEEGCASPLTDGCGMQVDPIYPLWCSVDLRHVSDVTYDSHV